MKTLITGGAGFIGCNVAAHYIRNHHEVTLFDNFSRRGSEANLQWLNRQFGDSFRVIRGDVRDFEAIQNAARGKELIFHFAAQVAVTTSVYNPREDFEINALGTFNTLEAARLAGTHPIFLYTSTNKVYGGMEAVSIIEEENRYRFGDYPQGISEEWPLDFHSPYGCSKGTGDQYVRDYYRIYNLPTIVFRQSAIYGPRQFGVEDQGWLAFFLICTALGKSFTIYGDGKQVRDLLYIDDLVKAMDAAVNHIQKTAGQVYNIGGGPDMALAVWTDTKPILEKLTGKSFDVSFSDWRPGDQKIFVSNINKAKASFGWQPSVVPEEGIKRIWNWIQENRHLF